MNIPAAHPPLCAGGGVSEKRGGDTMTTVAQLEGSFMQLGFEEQLWLLERLTHLMRERLMQAQPVAPSPRLDDFLAKWTGFLKGSDAENLKRNYLQEKYA